MLCHFMFFCYFGLYEFSVCYVVMDECVSCVWVKPSEKQHCSAEVSQGTRWKAIHLKNMMEGDAKYSGELT